MYQFMFGATQLENSFAEKAMKAWVDMELNMSQQCALAAKKASWAALGAVLPADQEKWSCPSTQNLVWPHWSTVSSTGLLSKRETQASQREPSKEPPG